MDRRRKVELFEEIRREHTHGAVDHAVHAKAIEVSGLAVAVSHIDSVDVFGVRGNSPGMGLDLAVLYLRGKPRADCWRYAVAMHIPIGADVTQEAPPLLQRKGAPDFLREWTKRVNHRSPSTSCSFRCFYLRANQMQKSSKGLWRLLLPEWWPGSSRPMRLRQQSSAGKDVDRPAKSATAQADGDVDTGESGANQ
jgi:hypothetical protein